MSLDLSQFHQVFFEESQEHLDTLENGLMSLDIDAPDMELLNSIFRAAHSIKGSSGVFGFSALGQITHVLENQLDDWRKEVCRPVTEHIDEMLVVVDDLRALLASYQAEESIDEDWVNQRIQDMETVFKGDAPASKAAAQTEDAGFGFFEDEEASNEDDQGFGFFEESEESAYSKDDHQDDGYGFFNEEAASAKTEPAEDPGFGFFDEPEPTTTQAAKTTATVTPASAPKTKAVPPAANATASNQSIRVNVDKVDSLINLVGELVITQSMLAMMGKDISAIRQEKLEAVVEELQRNTREIQESVMSIRMLPVSFVFNRFPRVVRDIATKLGKKVELVIEGGDTEIDKSLVEKLSDPLTHLVRNSIDHGIETPEKRKELGKSETGTVRLSASQQGGNIVLSIMDDGGGLSRDRILSKARERGMPVDDNMPDHLVWQLIFEAGFSTAEQVTDVSGRGVGMDVVKKNLTSLGGRIDIESVTGFGTTLKLLLPLTLAILDGMAVAVGEETYIVPLASIVESIQPSKHEIKTLSGDELLDVRGHYWPIVRLHKTMQVDTDCQRLDEGIVVLVESGKQRFGILADRLIGQQQVVIKSLEQHFKRIKGVSGATIMGDGHIALILDLASMAKGMKEIPAMEAAS
ncbi:chemotaxis protein CheA [Saccharospirillum sp. MSK14-1]|uniref:chemotaxis protein CheA n=1 Tax=Saccharospirillum sp. MSK14-1 TaxID=1897632 RepID=UPI000D337154|nr:chemotaxis protein CheA [Saccharospirillum sp. MSK14-1]PTY37479.1 chemotaxis protein CheA [Saccharospirillum sp. MSK14-1]